MYPHQAYDSAEQDTGVMPDSSNVHSGKAPRLMGLYGIMAGSYIIESMGWPPTR